MYRDVRQWRDIRRRILEKGTPKRRVSAEAGISRKTINKMLAHEHPPGYRPGVADTQNWHHTSTQLIDCCTITFHFHLRSI